MKGKTRKNVINVKTHFYSLYWGFWFINEKWYKKYKSRNLVKFWTK